ncbi:hypothetical protein KY285_019626 [Solanum tuberosum]|nr:hypothetical protein KY285_019626 [Solanum tuberosum]
MSTVPSMSVAGQSWEDPTPSEWPENDYCLLCGNLGNEVNDDVLTKVFSRIPTFNKAKGERLHTVFKLEFNNYGN